MESVLQGLGANIVNMDFRRDPRLDRLETGAVLETPPDSRPVDLTNALRGLEEVTEVEVR